MGQHQCKDELLYEQVTCGNLEDIKALCSKGAGLEWIGKDGKTPLTVACMNPELYNVAKTLIEVGANINHHRPGCHAGTPLHHAAKKGLAETVKLLLSHGANPLARNDARQTPLDVARARGFTNVVRAIETHICFFSGWLREFYGPGFLEAFAPQFLSRKIWVVILPCGTPTPTEPLKPELVIYSTPQDAQPRTTIALWMATIEEPKFNQPDPTLKLFEKTTKTRYKFASANNGDRQQLQLLYNACRGIPQATPLPPPPLHDTQTSVPVNATETAAEAVELAMAINTSIQSAMNDRPSIPITQPTSEVNSENGWGDTATNESQNGWGPLVRSQRSDASNNSSDTNHNGWAPLVCPPPSEVTTNNGGGDNGWAPLVQSRPLSETITNEWIDEPAKEEYSGWGVSESTPVMDANQNLHAIENTPISFQTSDDAFSAVSVPSDPPLSEEILDEGRILYPSIDLSPVDFSYTFMGNEKSRKSDAEDENGSSFCIICWESPVEGACIPCGHMAGCMACLDEIKIKKGDCPVCRAKIGQVIRFYAV